MPALSAQQKDFFWDNGYLVVPEVISQSAIKRLQSEFATWVEESRAKQEAYGDTLDGRPRFDLEPGHSAARPGLRRVNAPIEISQAYFEAMSNSLMTDCVAELIGPNVKFHHSKINSKLPGAQTDVKWHQDFCFTPHSNDDLITALLMVDPVTEQNGPLEVAPATHRGPLLNLWHNDVFTGAINDEEAAVCQEKSVLCTGEAGSVCLMHTRLLHGSTPNQSPHPRTLFISVYSAEDAISHCPNPVPTQYEGLVVRGESTGRIRSIPYQLRLPQKPTGPSFFDQQATHEHATRRA